MSERMTIHSWGFVDDVGNWIAGDASTSAESVHQAWERLDRHVCHFDIQPEHVAVTRDLSGWLVAVEFETPPREKAARMWHRIKAESDQWPDFPAAVQPDPTTTPHDEERER